MPRVLMPTRMCQGWHVRRRACRYACAHVHCSQTSHSARRVQRFCCSLRLALLQLDLDTHNVVLADLHGEPRRPADGSRRLLDRRRHECRRSGQAAEEEEEDGPHSKRGRGSSEVGSRALCCAERKKEARWAESQFELSFGTPYRRLFSAFILYAIFACATHGSAACATRGRASGAPAAGTTTNSVPRARCDGWQTLRAISRSRTLLEPISHLRAIGGGILNSRVCTTLPC